MNMTVTEMAKLINTEWSYPDGKGLSIWVNIIDVRESWGQTQCLIIPSRGEGQRWVNLDSLGHQIQN